MHKRKIVGPGMEPWVTPALTRYSCEVKTYHPEPFEGVYYWEKKKKRPNIWPKIKSAKKTSMPNSVKTLAYIKC